MIGLLSLLLRAVLLAGFTFAFVVLYEHGPQGFSAGVPVEMKSFENFVMSLKDLKSAPAEPAATPAPTADPVAPAPAATPVMSETVPGATPAPRSTNNAPSAWEQLQSRPIGAGMNDGIATPTPTPKSGAPSGQIMPSKNLDAVRANN